MRPPTGLSTSAWEVWGRLTSAPGRGGAKLPTRINNKPSPTQHIFEHGFHSSATSSRGGATIQPTTRSDFGTRLTNGMKSFTRSIYQGTFQSIKTTHSHPHGPYSSSSMRDNSLRHSSQGFATLSGRGQRASNRFNSKQRGSFQSRPSLTPSKFTGQHGLGSARNFSSSQPYFANVLHNVPLFLRAVGDQALDGMDEKKWRYTRSQLRRAHLENGKGKQRLSNLKLQGIGFLSKKDEMVKYFTLIDSSVEQKVEKVVLERSVEAELEPIVLILSVEPNLAFPASTPYSTLEYSVVQTFTSLEQAYTIHAQRIRALYERLRFAGVFDDHEHVKTEAVSSFDSTSGREVKEVHVTFDARQWTKKDVLSAVGEWEADGNWWRIVGGEEEEIDIDFSDAESIEDQPLLMPLPSHILEDHYASEYFSDNSPPVTASSSVSETWQEDPTTTGVQFEYQVDDDGTSAAWDEEQVSLVYEEGVQTFLKELDSFSEASLL